MALVHLGSRVAVRDECYAQTCCGVFWIVPQGLRRLLCASCLRAAAHAIDLAAVTLAARATTAPES